MKTRWTPLLLACFLAACGGGTSSPAPQEQPPPPPPPAPPPPPPPEQPFEFPAIELTEVAGGFVQPTDIQSPGDGSGRLFVLERAGTIRIVEADGVRDQPFLDIRSRVGSSANEQGLLGLAFAPDFASSGHFYVNYTDLDGDTVVARFTRADAHSADADSERVLLQVRQPFDNHNGGQLAFGPDGHLYVALGDGGGGDPDGLAQDPESPLGTILRIAPTADGGYTVPDGNPFGNEVWAYGLRNPWRIAFDRATGDLFIADVGERAIEEINFEPAGDEGGRNYGWPIMEGSQCHATPNCDTTGLTLPVWEYERAGGNCSITGGYVARGDAFPALDGVYVFGDFCSGRIWGITRDGDEWIGAELLDSPLRITTFGLGEDGALYVAGYSSGTVHRIVPAQ